MSRLPEAAFAAFLFASLAGCSGVGDMPYATAADANEIYPLGAGDKLRVTVFGEDTLSGEYTVTGDGDISFPLIGNVPASGRSIEELQATLTAMLDNGYVNDPRVSAEVLEYRPYYILGEVNRPGEYPYSVGLTVEQAVATAGGYTYRANNGRVFLKRSDDTQEKLVDLDRSPAFRLRPGDTVRVGERYF